MVTPRPDAGARNRRRLGIVLALALFIALVVLVLRDTGLPSPTPAAPGAAPADPASQEVLRIAGSGTIGSELLPDLAQAYLENRGATDVRRESAGGLVSVVGRLPGTTAPTRMEITATDSAFAFSGLRDGTTDIGMSSRRITPAEQGELAGRGDLTSRASEHILALDAVATIVNSGRDVSTLSLAQLRDVYTCTITDWSQLGPDAGRGPIRVLAFRDGSGTLDTFRGTVLGELGVCPQVERIAGPENMSEAVAADPAAIGFVGLPFVGQNTALTLYDGASVPIAPTRLNVSTESYVLTRRLYLYLPTLPVDSARARDFVEGFTLSEAGQRIVDAAGFVSPLFPPPAPPASASGSAAAPSCAAGLPEYCALTDGAERVPFDVRFASGTDEVDNRAFRNIALFTQSLAGSAQGREVVLVGFADNAGTDQSNLALSDARAAAVQRELEAAGVTAVTTRGFGEALPVDTNDTAEGREQNRRVEVWLR